MQFRQYHAKGEATKVIAVQPAWARRSAEARVANICRLKHLLKSNRQFLYERSCEAVLKFALPKTETSETAATKNMLPFQQIRIAGDGRCGWSAILASADVKAYCAVPRTEASMHK